MPVDSFLFMYMSYFRINMATYKLTYFNDRGNAEVARLIFAKAQVKYEDVRMTSEQFKEIKEGKVV